MKIMRDPDNHYNHCAFEDFLAFINAPLQQQSTQTFSLNSPSKIAQHQENHAKDEGVSQDVTHQTSRVYENVSHQTEFRNCFEHLDETQIQLFFLKQGNLFFSLQDLANTTGLNKVFTQLLQKVCKKCFNPQLKIAHFISKPRFIKRDLSEKEMAYHFAENILKALTDKSFQIPNAYRHALTDLQRTMSRKGFGQFIEEILRTIFLHQLEQAFSDCHHHLSAYLPSAFLDSQQHLQTLVCNSHKLLKLAYNTYLPINSEHIDHATFVLKAQDALEQLLTNLWQDHPVVVEF